MPKRRFLAAVVTAVAAIGATAGAAQAIVVSDGASGRVGVAMLPGTAGDLAAAGFSPVTSAGPCTDPALTSDLTLPSTGLCSHGGPVMHTNETFALTWDPLRRYWETTRNYLEGYLGDVAAASGTLTSPFALTGQYGALESSVYGGGCIDYGNVGGSSCQLGNSSGAGPGHNYPASGCTASGTSYDDPAPLNNDTCITDAQIQSEIQQEVPSTGMLGGLKQGHTPLLVMLLPPRVEVCVDNAGKLCSANSDPAQVAAQFCSYHSHVTVAGTDLAYVVQPWTAYTGCDEPDVPALSSPATSRQISLDAGTRIVTPLSEGQIAALVNPDLNAWSALDGSEINDNHGCVPFGIKYDTVTVGSNTYYLQREFNNAGVIKTDPNAPPCAAQVELDPAFVVPSAVNAGDVVEFDGSTTASTLIVPGANYTWSFGDGTTAIGPSVSHSYGKGGTYTVKLAVTDRGGNVATLSQQITVLGAAGQSVTPPPNNNKKPGHSQSGLTARMQLMPQGFHDMLRRGIATRVTSNQRATAFVTLSIPRAAARRAHLGSGRGRSVVVGRGTVSLISAGTVNLHLRFAHAVVAKLARLHHVALTVRLVLVSSGGNHVTIDAAGRY
jgi:hypothetical protein